MLHFNAIRHGNVSTGLDFFQTGQPFIPSYVANGWLGGCCDEFGFHARPQLNMDHGRTGLGYQLHYVRRHWGGHDLAQLAHLQATYADGRLLGLARLGAYHQELDLATATQTTRWSSRGSQWTVRHFASWAVPQCCEWSFDQTPGSPVDLLALRLNFATAAADNNSRRDPRMLTVAPQITITTVSADVLRLTSTTNCRTTTVLLHGRGLRLEAGASEVSILTNPGIGTLRLLVLDPHLDPAIAADPVGWLNEGDPWPAHVAAVERRWSTGVLSLPPGPAAQVWLRSRYYAITSLPPYPSHIQDPTGLCANIWGHGFAQDQYYVTEALPRMGLADIARAQMPVWVDHLPEVLRYTRRLAGVDGAFYPWIPPFEDWDAFEADGPANADSFELHNSAYVAAMAWSLHRYTGDRTELARHLPMLREIARFYVAITVLPEHGGARIQHPQIRSQDEAMPPGHPTEHPLCCLWAATYSLRAWLAARERLGGSDDPSLAATCAAILTRGYDLDALRRPEGGLKTCLNDPRPAGAQKHPVQLNAIALLPLPGGVQRVPVQLNPIGLLPLPELMEDSDVIHAWRNRLDLCHDTRKPYSGGWTFGLFTLASARMRDGEAVAADLALVQPARYADGRWIQFYESSCRNGWQHKKAYYFTTSGLYLQALTDAVVQDCRGHIDLCAALLPEWRMQRIEVDGIISLEGARVDGWYEAGRCRFTITPQSDGPVAIRLGLPGRCRIDGLEAGEGSIVTVAGRAGVAVVVEG